MGKGTNQGSRLFNGGGRRRLQGKVGSLNKKVVGSSQEETGGGEQGVEERRPKVYPHQKGRRDGAHTSHDA